MCQFQGLGKGGSAFTELLQQANATVIGCDASPERRVHVSGELGIQTVDTDDTCDASADIFAPCARGGSISQYTLPRPRAEVIAVSATNQLADPHAPRAIVERGSLYAPD